MAGKYLGTLLVERGVLEPEQVNAILHRQQQTGQPFGEMAITMYNVRVVDVWRAIATQRREKLAQVNLDQLPAPEKGALELVPGRLAWASKILPLRLEGDTLVCVTTAKQLCDAMALLHERLDRPIEFLLADELQLKQHIMAAYPL